jgi:hypothetical protein
MTHLIQRTWTNSMGLRYIDVGRKAREQSSQSGELLETKKTLGKT